MKTNNMLSRCGRLLLPLTLPWSTLSYTPNPNKSLSPRPLVLWELCPCPWYFQVFYWRYASTTLQAAPRILGTSRHVSELTSLLLSYCISLTGLSLFLSDNHLCRLLSDAKVKVALEVGEGASELHCWFMWNPQPADSLRFCGCVQFSPVQSLSHVQSCCQTSVFILDMKLIL